MATADKRVMTEATGQAIVAELRKIPGVTNPLPVAKGGTGLTSLDQLKEALNVPEKLEIDVEAELDKRVQSVNSVKPDAYGNVQILHVPTADNLASDEAQVISGTFVERTTGGDASISDGSAYVGVIYGASVRSGYTPETANFEVLRAVRTDDAMPIEVTMNWDTYRTAVSNVSTNKTFTYTSSWNENPATYGLTITGTPVSGDVINVYFIAENRGLIANATPTSLCETNWNLYDNTKGYARVLKYSETHGFKIGGTYTGVSFAATVNGSQTVITPDANGIFTVPESGYVFVTGGNAEDTYILMTWSDWTEGYSGDFVTNAISEVDFSSVMQEAFPFGLCAIGTSMDEINFSDKVAYVRIERIAYSRANLITIENSGKTYTYDTEWIYSVKETPDRVRFTIDNSLAVYDHGMEYFTGTVVPPVAFILYGQNLRDKLRTDVLTISEQNLSASQKAQVRINLGLGTAAVKNIASAISNSDIGLPTAAMVAQEIGALNEAITKITLPTKIFCSSQSDFETKANTLAGTLSNGEIASVAFGFPSGMIFNGTSAWGYINRYSATRWNMILTSYDESTYVVNIQYNNGTFKYTDLNSKLTNTTGTCTSTYGTITYVRQANIVTITGSCSGMVNNAWVTLCNDVPKCVKAIKFVAYDSSGTKNVSINIENTSVQFYGRNESTSCAFGATYITENIA